MALAEAMMIFLKLIEVEQLHDTERNEIASCRQEIYVAPSQILRMRRCGKRTLIHQADGIFFVEETVGKILDLITKSVIR